MEGVERAPRGRLRPAVATDHRLVLDLNRRNVTALAPMDEPRLGELEALADRFDVVEVGGAFAGFVITFAPGTSYDSENYRWFTERYGDRFYYLDRIVLDERYRRRGLAGLVYDEMERVATGYGRLALEVNLLPRNDASLAFHSNRGYREVAQREEPAAGPDPAGVKRIAMMTKELG
jgi:predicted GNAT superfamily acetyltransferase